MTKLSRAQIKEGLKSTPIENILLGHQNADKVKLTKKQKDFARKVAEGKPKAQAYRETYNSKAKPQSQAEQASRLSADPKIKSMIDAFTLANEAREYLIPEQIRTMAIQNLVSIAINEGEKTSNKLKALELIGKMSEVALFSERKEHIHLHSSIDIKSKLLEGLRNAFTNSKALNDQAKIKAQSLLLELDRARTIDADDIEPETPTPSSISESADPTTTPPPKSGFTPSDGLHSNSHTRTSPIAEAQPTLAEEGAQSLLDDLTITAVIVTNPSESNTCASISDYPKTFVDGEGVLNPGSGETIVSHETPPLQNPIEKG